ncbi:unnamed protein product [Urochloa decumbens]|uniref:Large ribosomal subunit protein uL11m n=1 Tax=Urochloa decumbens TaxID=240449 RepID=A0ABC8WML8_9POAL
MNTAMATTSLSLQGRPCQAAAKKLSSPFLGAPASFLRPVAPASTAAPSRRTLAVRAMAPPKPGGKAKKVVGMIKLALEAGKATPAPPVGPALGAKGVNIMMFCKEYNAKTADKPGYIIPVEITVFDGLCFALAGQELYLHLEDTTSLSSAPQGCRCTPFTYISVNLFIVMQRIRQIAQIIKEIGHKGRGLCLISILFPAFLGTGLRKWYLWFVQLQHIRLIIQRVTFFELDGDKILNALATESSLELVSCCTMSQ